MWLYTTVGFFSIVQDQKREGTLVVRAREKKDLEQLRDTYLPTMRTIWETEKADYRFRAFVSRQHLAKAMERIVEDVTYPNFKDAVAVTDEHRSHIYAKVWDATWEIGQELPSFVPDFPEVEYLGHERRRHRRQNVCQVGWGWK